MADFAVNWSSLGCWWISYTSQQDILENLAYNKEVSDPMLRKNFTILHRREITNCSATNNEKSYQQDGRMDLSR